MTSSTGRRTFAPEVIQTSVSDCGPAALKCIAEGYGVPLSYGRLREACQTDVDGSSIDSLEEVLRSLGFDAEQTLLPVEHLLSAAVDALPAVVVVVRENGALHFVVAWRAGPFGVQVMDPAVGRGWLSEKSLREQLYRHTMAVPAEAWREWAASPAFQAPLRARLVKLGVSNARAAALSERAVAEPGWRAIAGLDACARLVEALIAGDGLRAGADAAGALEALWATAREEGFTPGAVPAAHWSAVEAEPQDDTPMLRVTGALLLSVRGRAAPQAGSGPDGEAAEAPVPESAELRAALSEKPVAPLRALWSLLFADGWGLPALAVLGVAAGAVGLIVEGVALRGLVELGASPGGLEARAREAAAVVALLGGLLAVEAPTVLGVFTLGRRLELRLRRALFRKLPRLPDRYVASRPVSDMGARGHSLHVVRTAPELARRGLEAVLQLGLTTAAIGWLDGRSGVAAAVVAVGALVAAWLVQPLLAERELKLRTHHGGLGRFTLDALLGLTPIRAHSAEPAVRRGHSWLLTEWRHAGRSLQAGVVALAAVQACWAYGGAFAVVWLHLSGPRAQAGTALLLAYWALSLPALGAAVVELARQAPGQRNVLLRLLEPLGAEDEASETSSGRASAAAAGQRGVELALRDVTLVLGGHVVLEQVNLEARRGEHLAVVGRSGAGKSSLAGLLLGWHRATRGQVEVDGAPLQGEHLVALRARTAWVEPGVQLWNLSLADNIEYGAPPGHPPVASVLADAELAGVVESLPEGLDSRLGEGGGLVSGGEGQRVRLARALMRRDADLVVLDEPFRGLGHAQRQALLARCREVWRDATLICITHDVEDTLAFPRVVVVDDGTVAEDGVPAELERDQGSRYRALLEGARAAARLWGEGWRHLALRERRLVETEEKGP